MSNNQLIDIIVSRLSHLGEAFEDPLLTGAECAELLKFEVACIRELKTDAPAEDHQK